jgi:sensor domain CHASE-containing protein
MEPNPGITACNFLLLLLFVVVVVVCYGLLHSQLYSNEEEMARIATE